MPRGVVEKVALQKSDGYFQCSLRLHPKEGRGGLDFPWALREGVHIRVTGSPYVVTSRLETPSLEVAISDLIGVLKELPNVRSEFESEVFLGLFAEDEMNWAIGANVISQLADSELTLRFDLYPPETSRERELKWVQPSTSGALVSLVDLGYEDLQAYVDDCVDRLGKGETLKVVFAADNGQGGATLLPPALKKLAVCRAAIGIDLRPPPG
jgi:hypothetical protein